MKWHEVSISELTKKYEEGTDEGRLAKAFDDKYGLYDYATDLRSLDEGGFVEVFVPLVEEGQGEDVLVCGSNGGFEVRLMPEKKVTALDISGRALNQLSRSTEETNLVQGNINGLPFEDDSFDIYVAMRTLQSSGVDLHKAVLESLRVTKVGGRLVYSIPNGYLIDGEVVKGMYDHQTQTFDTNRPHELAGQIADILQAVGEEPYFITVTSEIIIVCDI